MAVLARPRLVDELQAVLAETFGTRTDVTADSELGGDLSLDSFAWLEFLMALEERFEVDLLERVAEGARLTLGGLAEMIAAELEERM